ncbi:hypothetical protein J1N35_014578 [Gossypium stocksii]|uniref:Uncharacterized protein n=1 Tax=Gossypium stocksii TaxID=47602 RepID=A0A9D4AA15_9ROSI|nr:hypothetical protein J1N35_014578 [Gossypium stocksii]
MPKLLWPFSIAEWEEFQKKWKDSGNFYLSLEPEPITPIPIEEADEEEEEVLSDGMMSNSFLSLYEFPYINENSHLPTYFSILY